MTLTVEHLRAMPRPERFAALESVVVAEFKAALLMDEADELLMTSSFFDLGLTSLGLTDVKQRIEDLLGLSIGSTVMFNSPTVEQLMDRLTSDVLGELFEAGQR